MQNLSNKHSRKREIIGVLALAGGLGGGVNERDALADDREIRHLLKPF